jgi:UTP-glucose-1-phosphate uridylyltransferase
MKSATSPTLLVLAAGMGSRYGGLKQIEPVGPSGEAIIDYSVFDALRAGFGKLVFVIRKDIEQAFKEFVGARFEKQIPVEYVYQELDKLPTRFKVPEGRTKPWGTTQAVLMTEGVINEPFAMINADDFYGAESYRVLAEHLKSGSEDYAMVGFVLRNTLSDFGTVARGVCQVGNTGYLTGITEMTAVARDGHAAKNTDANGKVTQLTGDEPVSMNYWGFTPKVFPQLREYFVKFLNENGNDLKKECYIPNTVNDIIVAGQGRVKVLKSNDPWFGVTYREDHAHVVASIQQLVKEGKYPEKLWP